MTAAAIILALLSQPVTITAYTPDPAETDSTPTIAKCGPVRAGTVALSRDLWRGRRCGDRIGLVVSRRTAEHHPVARFLMAQLRRVGLEPPARVTLELVVWDSMARRWRRRVDLFMWTKARARAWGRRRGDLIMKGR